MEDKRKTIIVNEIMFWKKNRILPEHYCDYLLALYTEGSQSVDLNEKTSLDGAKKINYLFLLLIPLFVVLIYFTELSFILQTMLITFFILIGIIVTLYYYRKGVMLQIPIISSALLLLLASVEFASKAYPQQPEAQYVAVAINCLLWLLSGWKFKLVYLVISGLFGIVLLLTAIFIL